MARITLASTVLVVVATAVAFRIDPPRAVFLVPMAMWFLLGFLWADYLAFRMLVAAARRRPVGVPLAARGRGL